MFTASPETLDTLVSVATFVAVMAFGIPVVMSLTPSPRPRPRRSHQHPRHQVH